MSQKASHSAPATRSPARRANRPLHDTQVHLRPYAFHLPVQGADASVQPAPLRLIRWAFLRLWGSESLSQRDRTSKCMKENCTRLPCKKLALLINLNRLQRFPKVFYTNEDTCLSACKFSLLSTSLRATGKRWDLIVNSFNKFSLQVLLANTTTSSDNRLETF